MPRGTLDTNARPVALVRSWLRATGIAYAEGLAPPTDLVVGEAPKSVCVHVTLGSHDKGERLDPPGVNLDGSVICYGSLDDATAEFWRILTALGINEPLMPFDRGAPLPDRARIDRDGEELILFRHDKFRKSPNPSPAQVRAYENVVGMAAKIFWRQNRWMMDRLNMEFDEVLSYVWVWATTYMAHYELPGGPENNQKLMLTFLQQQLWELNSKLKRKVEVLRAIYKKNLHTETYQYQNIHDGTSISPVKFKKLTPQEKLDFVPAERFVNTDAHISSNFRRGRWGGQAFLTDSQKNADALITRLDLGQDPLFAMHGRDLEIETTRNYLMERLAALPHEEMVGRLKAAARANSFIDRDARDLAIRELRTHQKECGRCQEDLLKPIRSTSRRGKLIVMPKPMIRECRLYFVEDMLRIAA